ncbi:hypothetical protein [Flavobacterium selenitireducens]|uniref:hypothetical protein n=1 Tax=Flavobacterium selenitireducens TaxID=2722704 RepID=UPI00168BAD99|nr:hypothetical protein [Flavobacterium selenitireducens]MBD3581413.1 hypothetical protein [Flavobacterium selenitireducens]
MRAIVRLVLLLFVIFLSTPTIIGMIKKSCDTTCVYNMSEEEWSAKEIKAELKCDYASHIPISIEEMSAPVKGGATDLVDSFSARILIPPPEQV